MYISRFKIADLYESTVKNKNEKDLLLEMDEKVIDYLNDNVDKLPFEHLFGDDIRIIIPIYSDPTAKEILQTLKRIKDYDGLDLDTKEVVRKIKLDPKYGGGEKEQRMNIGSAISKLKISDEDKKKYLDWLARYKDNMKDTLAESKFLIILSRAPIDIVRMSDHRSWTSCHSKDGSFFQCAINEAIRGGAVAYIVRKVQFEEFIEEGGDLNDEEIFVDYDRSGVGTSLYPISRLRVRRLVDDEDNEFAIPDTKIYGKNDIPGFYEGLKGFLQEKQPISFEDFENVKWFRRGGTYYDNKMNELIGSYFDVGEFDSKMTEHDYDDESQESYISDEIRNWNNRLDEECEEMMNRWNQRLTMSRVDYTYENDDDPYVIPYGETTIEFEPSEHPNVNFDDIQFEVDIEEGDVSDITGGKFDDEIAWSYLVQFLDDSCREHIKTIKFEGATLFIDFNSLNFSANNAEDYDNFCDNIRDFEKDMIKIHNVDGWNNEIFPKMGLIKTEITLTSLEHQFIDNSSDSVDVDFESHSKSVSWKYPIEVFSNGRTVYDYFGTASREIINNINTILKNYLIENFSRHTTDTSQQTFKNFVESFYSSSMEANNIYSINDLLRPEMKLELGDSYRDGSSVYLELLIKLESDNLTTNAYNLLMFIDQNYDDIKNIVMLCFLHKKKNTKDSTPKDIEYYNKLYRIYGKYL